jgi:prevent-host-death family protein
MSKAKSKGGTDMQIALTDLKVNVGKYVDLAEVEDIIITKYGKPIAKIVRVDSVPWYMRKVPKQVTDIEQLFGTLPSDIDLDDVKTTRLTK